MPVTFMTVTQFKEKVGATSFEVLKNPKTSKLFLAGDNGENYKVEGAIDNRKEMRMLIEDNDLANACLVNVKPGAEVQFTLQFILGVGAVMHLLLLLKLFLVQNPH